MLRALLRAGADPNKGAQYELPLAIAIQVSGTAGVEPVELLLDAGANPNLATSLPNESTALFAAATTRNWEAALLLLQRGADWRRGKSVNGMPFKSLIDSDAGAESGDTAFAAASTSTARC